MRHRGAEPGHRQSGRADAPPRGSPAHRPGGPLPLTAPGIVRCPRCGAEAPDDAAWCPRCGKPVELELLDLGRDDRPPPVVETGRDRRPIVVSIVVAVLLAGLMLTSGGGEPEESEDAGPETTEASSSSTSRRRPRPSAVRRSTTSTIPPPVAAEPIDARLVLARSGRLVLVDPQANTVTERDVTELEVPQQQFGSARPAVVRRGDDQLVFQGDGATYVMEPFAPGPPRLLGESVLFVPGLADDEVWLVTTAPGEPPAARRWRVDGLPMSDPVPLPADWMPVAEVEAGLVLRRNNRFEVWDPVRRESVFTSEPDVNLVAAGGRTVAWVTYCEGPLCTLHLTDPATGADRVAYLNGLGVDYGMAGFSPDGRHLLVPGHRLLATGTWSQGLIVVDVVAATVRFTQEFTGQVGQVVWSRDGRWAFLLQSDSPVPDVTAYSVADERFVRLELPSDAGGSVAAVF